MRNSKDLLRSRSANALLEQRANVPFREEGSTGFRHFFFKSLGPCQQANIYFSWEKESHSTRLTRVWLLGRGASWHVPHQPAPKCTDLLKGLYWWRPQTDQGLWRKLTSQEYWRVSSILTNTQFRQEALNSLPHSSGNVLPKHVKI